MADSPHVLLEVADGVAVVTLNRPDHANAFSKRLSRWIYSTGVRRSFRTNSVAVNVSALALPGH